MRMRTCTVVVVLVSAWVAACVAACSDAPHPAAPDRQPPLPAASGNAPASAPAPNTTSTVTPPSLPTPQADFDGERTVTRTSSSVTLDVALCTPDRGRIDVAFGSTTFAVFGKQGDKCIVEYGGEVENPRWDGKLNTTCAIPSSLGKITMMHGETGVRTAPIDAHCKAKTAHAPE